MSNIVLPARDSSISDRRQEQREKLLQAAYDLVPDVGVSGLRTRDIAQRAGVNIATLHYCFAGKEALLQALYDFIRDKFRVEFEERMVRARTPAERFVVATESRVELARGPQPAFLAWRAFMGEAWVNPTIRVIARRHTTELRERTARLLADGSEQGDITLPLGLNAARSPVVAASMVIALYEGILYQYALDPEAFELEDYAQAMYALFGIHQPTNVQMPPEAPCAGEAPG